MVINGKIILNSVIEIKKKETPKQGGGGGMLIH